jgi:protein-tyrosine phosphatase
VSPARILVVCHANVARSVAAAYLLTGDLAARGVDVEIATAGTHATEGQHVSSRTESSLAVTIGSTVALSSHRAHQLTDDDVASADLIVAMEAAQVRTLRRTHHRAAPKAATLGWLARELPEGSGPLGARVAAMHLSDREPDDRDDVVDPAGGDDAAYEATMALLVERCAQLARRLST